MKQKSVYPTESQGAWHSPNSFLFELVDFEYDAYLKSIKSYEEKELLLKKEHQDIDPEHQTSLIDYELMSEAFILERSMCYVILTSCLAIESFLNYYGVKRLGEEFYKTTLERRGITEKIKLIAIICFDLKLDSQTEILKTTQRLFEKRNSLVHPKSKESFKNGELIIPSPILTSEDITLANKVLIDFKQWFIENDDSPVTKSMLRVDENEH